MVATTCLSESEQNQPLPNKEMQRLLREVRQKTGQNWQITYRDHLVSFGWFGRKRLVRNYSVYVEVGGCLPFQWVTCAGGREETTLAYLFGLLTGLDQASRASGVAERGL